MKQSSRENPRNQKTNIIFAFCLACSFIGLGQVQAQPRPPASCQPGQNRTIAACLVGLYDLTLGPETGANLLLFANSRFDWSYSDVNGRKRAIGRWRLEAGRVVLVADRPAPNATVFQLISQEPWNETAEQRLRQILHQAAEARAQAQCPVFIGSRIRPPPSPEMAVPSEAATMAATASLSRAQAAKRAYEIAVARAVAAPSEQKAEQIEHADRALHEFDQSDFAMERAYQIAGIAVPALGRPSLPLVCTVPDIVYASQVTQAKWLRGISINIDDVSDQYFVSPITATLTYANGRTLVLQDARSGFAPFNAKQTVTAIELSTTSPTRKSRRFALTPMSQGVLNFSANGEVLVIPPFDQMSLRIDGGALVSNTYLPGRYVSAVDGN